MSELIFNCRFVVDDQKARGGAQERLEGIRKWLEEGSTNGKYQVGRDGMTTFGARLSRDLGDTEGHWEIGVEES